MKHKPRNPLRPTELPPDTLRHFSRDGPFVRLLALLIIKLPFILATSAGLVYWLGKSLHWWT